MVSPRIIADYAATAGAARTHTTEISRSQPGDPAKLADALVAFVYAPSALPRLPLGNDTVAAIETKNVADAAIPAEWREVSVSTDF